MDDSGDGLLSEEEMSEWLMDERSLDGDRDSRLSRIDGRELHLYDFMCIYIYIVNIGAYKPTFTLISYIYIYIYINGGKFITCHSHHPRKTNRLVRSFPSSHAIVTSGGWFSR